MDRLGATRWQRALATLGLFTLAAGDFWRYLLSWWGWGALVVLLLVAVVVELVRERARLQRLPITLLLFVALAVASIAWSAYPGASALGALALVATTVFAAFLTVVFDRDEALGAARGAFRWMLGLSLLFELFVSVVVRDRVLPLWVDYSGLDRIPNAYYWSRDLLLEGGRIQGIVGNSNLLGMAALLALVLFVARAVEHRETRAWSVGWAVVAVAVLALTRSSTVIAAAGVVAFLALCAVLVRHTHGRRRLAVYLAGLGVALAGTAVVVVLREDILEFLGKSPDLTYRGLIWETVLGLAGERPVAGWGWVGYWPPWVAPFEGLLEFDGVSYFQAHNAALDVLLQLGGLGLAVFLVYLGVTVVRSWTRVMDAPAERLAPAVAAFAVLVALLVQSLTESRLLTELGWALLAVVAITSAPLSAKRREP